VLPCQLFKKGQSSGLKNRRDFALHTGGNRYPTLKVQWNEQNFGLTVAQCDQLLRDGEPRIEVLTSNNPSMVSAVHEGEAPKTGKSVSHPNQLQLVPMTLQEGEDLIVARRLREILNNARKKV